MPARRQNPFPRRGRRDAVVIWVVGALLLGPALTVVYAVGQWLAPGIGPRWYEGLVQGALVPPVVLAILALWRRRMRRRQAAD